MKKTLLRDSRDSPSPRITSELNAFFLIFQIFEIFLFFRVPAPESAPESAPEVSPHPEDPVPEVQGNYFRIIFPPGFKPPQGLRY